MRISDEPIAKQLFGSRLKRRILRFLFKDQAPVSQREMARMLGVSHTAVNKAMGQLLDLNVVKAKTVGNALVWELKRDSFAYPYVKAIVESDEASPLGFIKDMIVSNTTFYNLLIGIFRSEGELQTLPVIRSAYIFGSVADGTSKPESDVDILFIIENSEGGDRLASIAQTFLGVRIMEKFGNMASFHIYSEKEVATNKPEWLAQAIRSGIKVYG